MKINPIVVHVVDDMHVLRSDGRSEILGVMLWRQTYVSRPHRE